ncbi:MAG: HD domain-containing protein [Candidatus Woesearchaeota archaeon]
MKVSHKKIINNIRRDILVLCKDQDWDWKNHICAVVVHSKILAKEYSADEEVCEIAAWLHDIKKLRGESELHHLRGAKEASEILKKHNYPDDKITAVTHAIISHSQDSKYIPHTIEAKVVSCADALSHFDNFLALTDHVFRRKKMSLNEGNVWLCKKYNACWEKLKQLPLAQEKAHAKYSAIMDVLKSDRTYTNSH